MNPVKHIVDGNIPSPVGADQNPAPLLENEHLKPPAMQPITLPDSLSSRQALRSVILEIRHYSNWLGQQTIKERYENNQPDESLIISESASALIKAWHAEQAVSQKSLTQLTDKLEEIETIAPTINITLTGPAPNNIKVLLIKWCRQNIDPNTLVEMNFNSTMLGGLVVRYGSHIYDWSLRSQILAAISRFPEVLRRV